VKQRACAGRLALSEGAEGFDWILGSTLVNPASTLSRLKVASSDLAWFEQENVTQGRASTLLPSAPPLPATLHKASPALKGV